MSYLECELLDVMSIPSPDAGSAHQIPECDDVSKRKWRSI